MAPPVVEHRYLVVKTAAERILALDDCRRDGFQWVSTSRVPALKPGTFIPGAYRMKFERRTS